MSTLEEVYQARQDATGAGGKVLQDNLTLLSPQEFTQAYSAAHEDKYGVKPRIPMFDGDVASQPPALPTVMPTARPQNRAMEFATEKPVSSIEILPNEQNTPGRYAAVAFEGLLHAGMEITKTATELANFAIEHGYEEQQLNGPGALIPPMGPTPDIVPNKSMSENIVGGIAQFTAPYLATVKAFDALQIFKAADTASPMAKLGLEVTKDAIASIPVDFAAFDPHDNNIADMVSALAKQHGFEAEWLDFLKSSPADGTAGTALENRAKAAIANLPVNGALGIAVSKVKDGAVKAFMLSAKAVRAMKMADWAQVESRAAADLGKAKQPGRLNDIGGAVQQSAQQLSAVTRLVASRMMRKMSYADAVEKLHPEDVQQVVAQAEQQVKTGKISEPKAGGFYSSASRAIDSAPQDKATGEQWAAHFKKSGVKQEELDWLGVPELLNGRKSVTREELRALALANQVKVTEVVKGGGAYNYVGNEWQQAIDRAEADGNFDEAEAIQRAWEGLDPVTGSTDGAPKYADWQIPGGSEYHELLLTLPEKDNIRGDATAPAGWGNTGDPQSTAGYTGDRGNDFRGGHYHEPNVVAHVRFNERTDASGARMLFVEEVQSDWHQKGRKQGYRTPPDPPAVVSVKSGTLRELFDSAGGVSHFNKNFDKWLEDRNAIKADLGETALSGDSVGQATFSNGELLTLTDRIVRSDEDQRVRLQATVDRIARQNSEEGNSAGRVPDAPFKTSWPLLGMKRAIQWAVEHGYDKVGWTTGAQQAERYDLSKQVESIVVTPPGAVKLAPDTTRNVTMSLVGADKSVSLGVNDAGNIVEGAQAYRGQPLADVVGKDMADKIMGAERATFEGEDLKVGGEGMKAFYDQMLPHTLAKYVKKWGAKVGTSSIEVPKPPQGRLSSPALKARTEKLQVHTIEITPEMRKSVMDGQPLAAGDSKARNAVA